MSRIEEREQVAQIEKKKKKKNSLLRKHAYIFMINATVFRSSGCLQRC